MLHLFDTNNAVDAFHLLFDIQFTKSLSLLTIHAAKIHLYCQNWPLTSTIQFRSVCLCFCCSSHTIARSFFTITHFVPQILKLQGYKSISRRCIVETTDWVHSNAFVCSKRNSRNVFKFSWICCHTNVQSISIIQNTTSWAELKKEKLILSCVWWKKTKR